MGNGEFALIDWIRKQWSGGRGVILGPGDDCAVLSCGGRRLLVTTDILLDGTHFILEEADPALVGRKAVAVGLSDIAAMGGTPRWVVAAVGLPRTGGQDLARALYRGMRELAEAYDCDIVGGDVTVWPKPVRRLAICTTALGEVDGVEPILRSGARVGDEILVTGRLGGAFLGRHLTFQPRVREARRLVTTAPIHAMIDISDGLSSDLAHVARESGVGALLRAANIPIHPDALRAAERSGCTPLHHALHDGEDFELLFTTDSNTATQLCRCPPEGTTITAIGEIIEEGLFLETEEGERQPLSTLGYEHQL